MISILNILNLMIALWVCIGYRGRVSGGRVMISQMVL